MRFLQRLGLGQQRVMPLEQARSDDWAPVPSATPQTILGVAEGTGPVRKLPVPPPPPPEAMRPRRR